MTEFKNGGLVPGSVSVVLPAGERIYTAEEIRRVLDDKKGDDR